MKYSVLKVVNGAFSIDSEWSDVDKAKVQFHKVCMVLWNASDTHTAMVAIVDESLSVVNSYKEYIYHDVPEEVEEPMEG